MEEKMTVSEYIFDFLEKKGVKNVFMVCAEKK